MKVLRHAYDKSGKLKSSAANDTAWAPLPPVATPDNRTYVANVLDQYTSLTVAGQSAATLTYDQNGNLTSDGTWTFAYDAENRLLSATKVGASVTYTYDALGRRQTKTVNGTLTNYLSAGDEEIGEYDGANNLVRRYIPGPGTDQPVAMVIVSGTTNTNRYFHADRQGSILAMADAAGALIEGPYTYDPYGNSASSTAGVPFRYAGRRLDAETGLYYYRARYYSASLGRFLQTDPVGYEDQVNSYAYVGNDPTNNVDPTGLWAVFGNVQIVLQWGSVGGRIDISVGYDTDNGAFGSVNAGGSDKIDGGEDAAGVQAGVGGGLGVAESSDVITTPAVTTDVDVVVASGSVVTNDPLLPEKGNNKGAGGTKGSAPARDTKVRAAVIGGGLGVGGSQIKTSPIVSCTQSRGCTVGSQSGPPGGPKPQTPKAAAQQPAAKVCSQTKHGRQCN